MKSLRKKMMTALPGWGKFLRRTNMDELPQFFNVLIGNMSLIGPKAAHDRGLHPFSSVIPSYKFRSLVKPGITGLAQIKGYRGPAKDDESIVNRYYWDAVYVRKAGLWMEIRIISKTIARGVYNLAAVFSDIVKKRNPLPQAANSSLS